jgi:VIT1/CCC1 family predicted Fe2+/Mn2+ transporter
MRLSTHSESHRSSRVGWLRAAVLGANDGLISTASLVVGVSATGISGSSLALTTLAGLVAGAMSMAAGEYVSVRTQADTEDADLRLEGRELEGQPETELAELAQIYVSRGLKPELARDVAVQLTAHDALGAHSRDELGITETLRARPIQAAAASAVSFACVVFLPGSLIAGATSITALISLFALGSAAAYAGGSRVVVGGMRVAFWGAVAMATTYVVGGLFGGVGLV